MMTPRAVDDRERRIFCQLHFCAWSGDSLRRCYELVVEAMASAGVPPNGLGTGGAPRIDSRYWATYKYRRKKLERANFDEIRYISLSHMVEGGVNWEGDWSAYATLWPSSQQAKTGWVPALIGGGAHAFRDLLPAIAQLSKARYGYRFHRNMLQNTNKERQRPWWRGLESDWLNHRLLLDVFHHNYLGQPHLDAPFGKTAMTLREWIEDDPALTCPPNTEPS